MILFIDTADFHQLHFALIGEKKIKEKVFKVKPDKDSTAKTLSYFKKFFAKSKWNEIEKVIVVSGPGSFSGIRVGVAMGLAFSLANDIPVFAITKNKVPKRLQNLLSAKGLKKINSNFVPEYGAEPNITPPKIK